MEFDFRLLQKKYSLIFFSTLRASLLLKNFLGSSLKNNYKSTHMKTDFLTIAILLISCILLPFTLLVLNNLKDQKQLLKKFTSEANRQKLNIDLNEKWKHTVLGIDPFQKKLLFVQKRNTRFLIEVIDLQLVKDIKLNAVSLKSKKYKNKENILERIDLEFILDSDDRTKILNLFDSILDNYSVVEMSHARQWNTLIQNHLQKIA